jgi:hypothetical protein
MTKYISGSIEHQHLPPLQVAAAAAAETTLGRRNFPGNHHLFRALSEAERRRQEEALSPPLSLSLPLFRI